METKSRIKPSLSILDYILEFFSLLSVLGIIILFVIYWVNAPEVVPIHYNIYGIADGFGSRTTLVILPIISVLTYIGLTVLNKFPHIFNFPVKVTEENKLFLYRTSTRMVRWTKLLICLLYASIVWQQIRIMNNQIENLDNVSFFILIACLVLCLIFYIVKMIRTNK